MRCRYHNRVRLALVLMLAATLAVLSAFGGEGAAPRSNAAICGARADEGMTLPGEGTQTGQSCQGCYHVVRQAVEIEPEPIHGESEQ